MPRRNGRKKAQNCFGVQPEISRAPLGALQTSFAQDFFVFFFGHWFGIRALRSKAPQPRDPPVHLPSPIKPTATEIRRNLFPRSRVERGSSSRNPMKTGSITLVAFGA